MDDLLSQLIFSLCCHCTSTSWETASSEAPASPGASASSDRVTKDVRVLTVVMTELKFRKVKRQVFLAHVVVSSDDSSLKERPEIVDAGRVYVAPHVLMLAMTHALVLVAHLRQRIVSKVLIGRNQFNLVADRFANEPGERFGVGLLDYSTDHISLTADRADNASLATATRDVAFLVSMAILVFAADVGLINFNDAHEFHKVAIVHRGPEPVAQIPCRLIGAGADLPMDLESADALLAIQHRVQHLEPCGQRVFRVREHSASQQRKTVSGFAALRALPVPSALQGVDLLITTTRAGNALRPAMLEDVSTTGFFRREGFHQLLQRHHERIIQEI